MKHTNTIHTRRYYAIDHLRTCMMMIVMLGHPLLPYVTVPRAFNDPSAHIGFDYLGVFLYSFAMQAFFVTAGFTAALIYARKGALSLWRNRFFRIFLPLLVAYICISPLMRGAYQFSAGVVEYGTISAGWAIFLEAEWLRWSKVYHLWFLLSLLVFTALTCLGLWILNKLRSADCLSQKVQKYLLSAYGIWGLVFFMSVTTLPSYILDTGRGTHWSMQVTLLLYFILGWFVYKHNAVIDVFKSTWLKNLIIALLVLPLCIWATRERLFNEENIDISIGLVAGVSNGVLGVCMSIALLGWFHINLNKFSAFGDALGKASYWIYLIHFPIVVAVGGLVSVFDMSAVLKYLTTVAISMPIIALSYYVLVLKTPLKYVIVGKTR